MKEKGKYIAGDDLFPVLRESSKNTSPQFIDKSVYLNKLRDDIQKAKESIYIDIPGEALLESGELSELLRIATQKGLDVKIRADQPSILPEPLRNYSTQNNFVWSPITIIDQEIIWYGYPFSKMDMVEYYPILRFKGEKTAQTIISILGMATRNSNSYVAATSSNFNSNQRAHEVSPTLAKFIAENMKCPKCKSHLIITVSSRGKPYLACSNCDKTMLIPVEVLNTYLTIYNKTCPHCGYPIAAKVSKYGLYFICKGYYCRHKFTIGDI